MNINFKKGKNFLHPILIGIYPLISLIVENFTEITLYDLFLPFILLFAICIILLLITLLIFKNINKSSLTVSLLLIIILFYKDIYNLVIENVWSISQNLFLFLFIFSYLACFYLIRKTNRKLTSLHIVLNIVTISFYLAAVINISKVIYDIYKVDQINSTTENLNKTKVLSNVYIEGKRDIYFFIFDQYARQDVLTNNYGFDNSKFINLLIDKGFYVANNSYSNYTHTLQSIASTFNMKYLNYLTQQEGKSSRSPVALYRLISSNKVTKYLKSNGYKYIHMGYFGVDPKLIDINFNAEFNKEYREKNNERTILEIVYDESILPVIMTRLNMKYLLKSKIVNDARVYKQRKIFYMLDKTKEIPDIKYPTFTVMHLLIPHPPYVMNRYGDLISYEQEKNNTTVNNYIEQLQFLNNKLAELIEIILKKSDLEPIIILQSDEGPYPKGYTNKMIDRSKYSQKQLKDKFAILNALYLPGSDYKDLYQSITPVNTFPLILKLYFGEDIELLVDKHYHSNYFHYYQFTDTSKIIKDN